MFGMLCRMGKQKSSTHIQKPYEKRRRQKGDMMKQVPPRGPTNIRRHVTKFGHWKFVNPCCRSSYMCATVLHCQLGNTLRTVQLSARGNNTHSSDKRALDTLVVGNRTRNRRGESKPPTTKRIPSLCVRFRKRARA